MKSIVILGSTGSIGTQTLDIVKQNSNGFKVVGLSVNKNIELLEKQIAEFKPEAVCVADEEKAAQLKVDIPVYKGKEGLLKLAKLESADTVVNSLVGASGIMPTLEAIKSGKNIALANKETLVAAGDIVMEEVRKNNVTLMPIDSEHSALFQCFNGEDMDTVNKIIITCSGGAFKHKTPEELKNVTAEDALKHPTWNMGAKITIDCATLMNKGFEVIEAHQLYALPYEKIDVVLHPQSIIHSLVEYKDHSVMAQLGWPDMKIPIQYALTYPKRLPNTLKPLDLIEVNQLTFKKPNYDLFPCLKLAYEAGKIGGTLPAVMNAANEIAVASFLANKIAFLQIPEIIKKVMDAHETIAKPTIEQIMQADEWARKQAEKLIGKI